MYFTRALCFMVCIFEVLSEHKQHSSKIFGGSAVVSATTYPYQVSIQDVNHFHFCGGSIIDASWVLTAAHCSVQIHQTIVAGTVDSSDCVRKPISFVKVHPNVDLIRLVNDIALVRISGYFTYTDTIQPIRLTNERPTDGSMATLTGWGRTNSSMHPRQLQVLLVRVIGISECRSHKGFVINASHICTLNPVGQDACYGDSGSAIQINGEQFGILSFGSITCADGNPTVYTYVPIFKPWISEVTGIQF